MTLSLDELDRLAHAIRHDPGTAYALGQAARDDETRMYWRVVLLRMQRTRPPHG
jgi:hypothetical protein